MHGPSIVVGVDGSPESCAAAAAGWMLARAQGIPCQLVHATTDTRLSLEYAGTGMATNALQLALLARVRADMTAALRDVVPAALVDGMVIRPGRTALVLEEVAAEVDATMLVLGGKHHSTLGRWLGGSTVQHAVRRLSVPLLVTAGDLRPRARVLVAVDSSYAAVPTAQQAIAFAQLLGGPLHAVHVVEPVPAAALAPEADRVERDVWTLLPIPDHHKVVRTGIPAETIAQEAGAWRADVIVVGSHGKNWVDRVLIGSVTEDLLNDLPAAMLVIPVPAPVRHAVVTPQLQAATCPTS